MKTSKNTLSIALAALLSSSLAIAETEVSAKITYEGAGFTSSGTSIGNNGHSTANTNFFGATNADINPYYGVTTTTNTPEHGSSLMKSMVKTQVYFDGDVNTDTPFHVEVQGVFDGKSITSYDKRESYTQRDLLREAYIDSTIGDWSVRTGKQQVVWGTADGMKLLDTINPTDYSEMAQNQMEDSRITTWMVNAEKDLENGGNIQIVVSQPKENIFAGLNRHIDTSVRANGIGTPGAPGFDPVMDSTLNNGTDTGHAFLMKGPDSITGVRNGFLNIAPDLGSVASRFAMAFTDTRGGSTADDLVITSLSNAAAGGYATYKIDGTDISPSGVGASAKVGAFNQTIGAAGFGALDNAMMENFTVKSFSKAKMTDMNNAIAQINGAASNTVDNTTLNYMSSGFKKAIVDTWNGLKSKYNPAQLTAMGLNNAGDLTGAHLLDAGFQPLYNTNLSSFLDGKQDSAFEYMTDTTFRTFNSFVNAKSQYVYDMPEDTDIDVATRFKGTTSDGVNYSINASYNYDKNPIVNLSWRGDAGQKLAVHKYKNTANNNTTLQLYDPTKVTAAELASATNTAISTSTAGALYGGSTNKAATLRFSQEVKRVKQIGGSFDTAIETKLLGPVVIRGEALYTKDGYSPVMNKIELSPGGLVAALTMRKADRFKYVLGVDITVLKNMLISTQFIQDRNLDYVDDSTGYTTDYATMHLSNGFKQAEENKEFYSLFFSKPFGASGEHRWNNIFMFEENGGKWNRLDAEFSINDDVQATIEYNKYWGNENTQFGQLKDSSNVQVGIKYSF